MVWSKNGKLFTQAMVNFTEGLPKNWNDKIFFLKSCTNVTLMELPNFALQYPPFDETKFVRLQDYSLLILNAYGNLQIHKEVHLIFATNLKRSHSSIPCFAALWVFERCFSFFCSLSKKRLLRPYFSLKSTKENKSLYLFHNFSNLSEKKQHLCHTSHRSIV